MFLAGFFFSTKQSHDGPSAFFLIFFHFSCDRMKTRSIFLRKRFEKESHHADRW